MRIHGACAWCGSAVAKPVIRTRLLNGPLSVATMPFQIAERIAGLSGWRRSLLSLLLGAAAALAFSPLHIIPVLIVSFTGLVWLVDGARGRLSAFLTGWWFGLGHFIAGLYWVGKSFSVAGVAEWAAPTQ